LALGVLTRARISGQKNDRRRVVIVDDSVDAGQLLAGPEQAREWQTCGYGAAPRVATLPDYQ